MESQFVNYRIVIFHDYHGDIVGVQWFANDELKESVGDCFGNYQMSISRSAYYGGPMFRLFNAIVKGAELM